MAKLGRVLTRMIGLTAFGLSIAGTAGHYGFVNPMPVDYGWELAIGSLVLAMMWTLAEAPCPKS